MTKYFDLKKHIQQVVSEKTENGLAKVVLDRKESDDVLRMASELRKALARDVGTRKLTLLHSWSEE